MGFSYSDELWHFGIKGMKWGIRRYQNEDGTLTEEGIQRYRTKSNSKIEFIRKGAIKKLDKNNEILNNKALNKIANMPNKTTAEKKAKIKAQEEFLKEAAKRTDAGLLQAIKNDDRPINDPIEESMNKDTIDKLTKYYGKKTIKELENYSVDEINKGADLSGRFYWARYDTLGDNIKAVSDKWSNVDRSEKYTIENNKKRHEEQYSALLKDFGLEDTEKSRRYLERLIG